MPVRTIYLSRELDELVKASGLPVSEVCQRALRHELESRRLANTPRRILALGTPNNQ